MKIRSKSGAVLGALVVAALVAASAASLTVDTATLGADTQTVAACDTTGIDVAYVTQYNVADQLYEVTQVQLLGVADACIGQLVSLTLSAPDDTVTPADGDTDPDVLAQESNEIIALSDLGPGGGAADSSDLQTAPQNGTAANEDFAVTLTTPVSAELIQNIAIVIA